MVDYKVDKKLKEKMTLNKPVNQAILNRRPQLNLTREQNMLNALFNDKNQLWGNGEPVKINNALTSGNGLIKTGSGDKTRRLFLP